MTPATGDQPEKDQSMDDILASIRRIMLDEQARLQDNVAPATAVQAEVVPIEAAFTGAEAVLVLDASMVVEELPPAPAPALLVYETMPERTPVSHVGPAGNAFDEAAAGKTVKTTVVELLPADGAADDMALPVGHQSGLSAEATVPGAAPNSVPVGFVTQQAIEALLAPAAAAAAAASVDALLRQLNEERRALLESAQSKPSLTIEEVVRTELRPFLKAWLDEHLPPLVERLVRGEINRLIGRSGL